MGLRFWAVILYNWGLNADVTGQYFGCCVKIQTRLSEETI